MSNNRANNKRALEAYRKQLEAMFEDISEIDIKCLNKAVNIGARVAKDNTPTVTSHMKKSWRSAPAVRLTGGGVAKSLVNSADYSSFVNDGHRIVNKSGETIGWVKGKYILEKAIKAIDRQLPKEFKKEVERVNRKHDK